MCLILAFTANVQDVFIVLKTKHLFVVFLCFSVFLADVSVCDCRKCLIMFWSDESKQLSLSLSPSPLGPSLSFVFKCWASEPVYL